MKHAALLDAAGWVVECESPLELRHTDGSFATGQAAHYVTQSVIDEAAAVNARPEPTKRKRKKPSKAERRRLLDALWLVWSEVQKSR